MAARWSSESVVAEHRELQIRRHILQRRGWRYSGRISHREFSVMLITILANAMALDSKGEYTLLAGRRTLALIRLDKPSEVVKKVSRTQQKYDVTAAEWNPTQSQGHTFVLACGERAEICQWSNSCLSGISSLRAHTRTITDLNWHRMDPHLLATCSIDTFVHIWDTREPRKPVASLSSIAGASQVKWNKLNQNLLASGHDCDIRVWDNRKTSQPTQFISAHLSKIQGLDWSPNHESHLVTSSNDCSVKFFDITSPRKAENCINTLSPVWRARYTPFGEGVVTVVAPQLRRGENPLLLWAVQDVTAPVHTFVGHSDMVLEFEWRLSGPGEHQLVTWARDHSLRIWRVDQHLQRVSESECECEAERELGLLGEEQGTSNQPAGNEDDARSDFSKQAEDSDPLKDPEKAQRGTSVEARATVEAGSGAAAHSMTDNSAAGDVSAATSVSSPQSLRSIVSALSGQTSTLPSGQPMSLQQEFSLLNTSLDSSQVNSVEVVAKEGKAQPSGVGEQEEEVVTIKEEIIDEEEVTMEYSLCTLGEEGAKDWEVDVKEEVADEEEEVTEGQKDVTEEEEEEEEVQVTEGTVTNEKDSLRQGVSMNVSENERGNTEENTVLEGDVEGQRPVLEGDVAEEEVSTSEGGGEAGSNQSVGDNVEEEVTVQKRNVLKEGDGEELDSIEEGSVHKTGEDGDTREESSVQEIITVLDEDTGEEGVGQKRDRRERNIAKEGDTVEQITIQRDTTEETVLQKEIIIQAEDVMEEDIVTEGEVIVDTENKQDTVRDGATEEGKDGNVQGGETVKEGVSSEESTVQKEIVHESTTEGKKSTHREVVPENTAERKRARIIQKGIFVPGDTVGEGGATQREKGTVQKGVFLPGDTVQEEVTTQGKKNTANKEVVQERKIKRAEDVSNESGREAHSFGVKSEAPVEGSVTEVYQPSHERVSSAAAASAAGHGNGEEGGGEGDVTKNSHLQESRIKSPKSSDQPQPHEDKTDNFRGTESMETDTTCVIKIQCSSEDSEGHIISFEDGGSPHKISFRSSEESHVSVPNAWDTPSVSLTPGLGDESLKEEEIIHVECENELEIVEAPKDEGVAVCQVVTTGSFVIKGAASSLMQVEASVVHLPEVLTAGGQNSEELWGTLAPQLLESGVIVPGENLVLGALSLVTMVETVEVEGETQTQITISPLAEPVEAYHQRGVNFILVTKNPEPVIAANRRPMNRRGNSGGAAKEKTKSQGKSQGKVQGQNAPRRDAPGPYKCDKCDKTYRVRSSLTSHRVTHNMEKMYKCDECDRAFHYSTPLMIHKRTHSDERPYNCPTCLASFKTATNLRCHQRQHSGERAERPINCPACGRGFRDLTLLKRHRQRMHQAGSQECSDSASPSSSPQKAKVDEETEGDSNTLDKSSDDLGGKEKESGGLGTVRRLSDYIHKCGLCQMTCHTRPQMLTHLQVHAAAERYRCRYCPNAYTFRFLLARHVRELHPGRPQWFCQHCDRIFDTCRKMNSHSCRSVRGNYSCPHHCGFTTEVRHRVFRHIARRHPEDAAPYHCDFCTNSYRDPGRLRYHQKRQHPDKMVELAPPPKDTWRALSDNGAEDKGAIDMSQVEVSVVDEAIEYYLPEGLRNDMAFQERVRFKCFYCDSKFPVKNAMTRHVLRTHPGQRAYKCLRCNVFFKSNTESKNHNRKYHKYQDTGGRDPQRNEKAMRKRAEVVGERLRHATPGMRGTYKFLCLHCPMAYRCKRPLVAHYRRWHPNKEWDHLPDRPPLPSSTPPSKRRKLLFFDCAFEPECGRTFDEFELCKEHLLHAHEVSGEEALSYVKERTVVEGVRRGRLPKNAVVLSPEAKAFGKVKNRRQWWRGRKRTKSNIEAEMKEEMDDLGEDEEEEDEDDFDEYDEDDEEMMKVKCEVSFSTSDSSSDEDLDNLNIKEENIDSVGDVKKMLYRCRICGLSCNSRAQYRQHTAVHANSKEQKDTHEVMESDSPEKVAEPEPPKKKASQLVKSEPVDPEEGIQVTSLREEMGEGEDDYMVLTLTSSASGSPMVKREDAVHSLAEDDAKAKKAAPAPAPAPPQPPSSPPSASPPSSPQRSVPKKLSPVRQSASKSKAGDPGSRRKGRPLRAEPKVVKQQSAAGKRKAVGRTAGPAAKKLQCPECSMSFKTRSEMSFHKRLDH
ncbi:GATOR complex protein WDR59 [Chionoecetes opilio]|uniref:GATOR complex protein WDR59 n=1 Tax=Chionoecetes opilio TaxID=41210 RepID=A0A8J4XVH5_CHIOP|nr:GATOR complex protein WDR59 [Chionoecetes opilio]